MNRSKVIVIDSNKKLDKKLKVCSYVRVSTDSEDQMNSYRTQMKYYQEYIQSNDKWIFVDIYADEGVSGRSLEKRDEFKRMLNDCRSNKIDRILVKSISRFARNTQESLETVRELKQLGVTIFFEKENIDTAKATDEFLFTLFSQIAQEESTNHSNNMKRSYKARMEQGKYITTKAPFGYEYQNATLVINQEEADIVRYIFESYINGVSKKEISDQMTRMKFQTSNYNDDWSISTIRRILKNEKYIGDALSQKTVCTDTIPPKRTKNKGQQPKYYLKNSHPAIIDRDIFDRTQRLNASNNSQDISYEYNPLSKKIFCSKCGLMLKLRRVNNINYRVCRKHDVNKDLCTLNRIPENEFNSAFVRMFNKLQKNKANIISPMIKDFNNLKEKRTATNVEVISLNKEIADLMEQVSTLLDLNQQGFIEQDFYLSQSNELKTRLDEIKKEKSLLMDKTYDEILSKSKALLKTLESVSNCMELADNDIFLAIVERIVVISELEIIFVLVNGMMLSEYLQKGGEIVANKRHIPYGYQIQGGAVQIIQSEAVIVNLIYDLYIEGHSYLAIAKILNKKYIRYSQKSDWNKNNVARIIKNEKYLGDNGFSPVVSKDKGNIAKEIANNKNTKKDYIKPEIKELLFCRNCNSRLNSRYSKWVCLKCEDPAVIRQDDFNTMLIDICNRIIKNNDLIDIPDFIPYSPNIEVKRLENELNMFMDRAHISDDEVIKTIFKLADAKYQMCDDGSKAIDGQRIINYLKSQIVSTEINIELIKNIVEKIIVHSDGDFFIRLKNGQEIR